MRKEIGPLIVLLLIIYQANSNSCGKSPNGKTKVLKNSQCHSKLSSQSQLKLQSQTCRIPTKSQPFQIEKDRKYFCDEGECNGQKSCHLRNKKVHGKGSCAQTAQNTQLNIVVHQQNVGDIAGQENQMIGTLGSGLRIQGFSVKREKTDQGFQIQYKGHLQNIGDTDPVIEGTFLGTRGQSRRLEGFSIYLYGPQAQGYDVHYQAILEGTGLTAEFSNGQFCGTRGQSRKIYAIKIWITERD